MTDKILEDFVKLFAQNLYHQYPFQEMQVHFSFPLICLNEGLALMNLIISCCTILW